MEATTMKKLFLAIMAFSVNLITGFHLEAQNYQHFETPDNSSPKCYVDLIILENDNAQLVLDMPSSAELDFNSPTIFYGKIDKNTGEASLQSMNEKLWLNFLYTQKQLKNPKLNQGQKQLYLPSFNLTWDRGNLPLKVIHQNKKQPLFSMKETPKAVVDIIFPLPQYSINPRINDSIMFHLFMSYFGQEYPKGKTILQAIDNQIDKFCKSYITENQEYYDRSLPDAAFNWERTYSFQVMCNSRDIFCIRILNYAFTGGAHGMEVSKYQTFNLKNGSVIHLAEQLDLEKQDLIIDLITKNLAKTYAEETRGNLLEAGFFSDHIELSNEIYITTNGLGFVYQPYEIAPYSFGSIEVFLEKEKILPFLKQNSFLINWFNKH
ncbi:MAG: hypothetical protein BWX51_00191 [Bacteroidetes bacterium ADurb.Bin012]|jgi:hypothetical protein|nr:MAG: hypothetical protein BWX51_00191 [Bacteroidetes bacterium ADurb.Bin012]